MKMIKYLIVGAFAVALMGGPVFAETCCEKAAKAGKECTHKCCVEAKKAGKVCEKCNPPKGEKKEGDEKK
jgi:hypothetical protein